MPGTPFGGVKTRLAVAVDAVLNTLEKEKVPWAAVTVMVADTVSSGPDGSEKAIVIGVPSCSGELIELIVGITLATAKVVVAVEVPPSRSLATRASVTVPLSSGVNVMV